MKQTVIWKAKVPPKIRVFGWKLASNSLGVQATRCDRNMDRVATCSICGMGDETNYHAMMSCTRAYALRQRLRKAWDLPDEEKLRDTGKEWVLVLLSQLDEQSRAKMLFIWWRAWHIRNNIIFGDGKCGIEQSALFLISYFEAFQQVQIAPVKGDDKGKQVAQHGLNHQRKQCNFAEAWKKPDGGWAKLNTDASFSELDDSGAWGAVLRNDQGDVLLSAWGKIPHCPNVVTAEALGMLFGVRAVLPVYAGPLLIESDNAMLVNELKATGRSKSQVADLVQDIRNSTQFLSDVIFRKINRTANEVADALC